MGFFGGSSQSTASNNNVVDFNPVINVGDGNTSRQDKTLENTATVSPKLDDSTALSASVGLGFGGSGSGGTATTATQGATADVQPTGLTNGTNNSATTYLLIGGAILVVMMLGKKKRK